MGSERSEQTDEQQRAAFWPDTPIQQRDSKT